MVTELQDNERSGRRLADRRAPSRDTLSALKGQGEVPPGLSHASHQMRVYAASSLIPPLQPITLHATLKAIGPVRKILVNGGSR